MEPSRTIRFAFQMNILAIDAIHAIAVRNAEPCDAVKMLWECSFRSGLRPRCLQFGLGEHPKSELFALCAGILHVPPKRLRDSTSSFMPWAMIDQKHAFEISQIRSSNSAALSSTMGFLTSALGCNDVVVLEGICAIASHVSKRRDFLQVLSPSANQTPPTSNEIKPACH